MSEDLSHVHHLSTSQELLSDMSDRVNSDQYANPGLFDEVLYDLSHPNSPPGQQTVHVQPIVGQLATQDVQDHLFGEYLIFLTSQNCFTKLCSFYLLYLFFTVLDGPGYEDLGVHSNGQVDAGLGDSVEGHQDVGGGHGVLDEQSGIN